MIGTTEELVRVELEEREKKKVSEYIEKHPGLESEMSALHLEFDESIRNSLRQTGLTMIEDEKKEIDGQIDGLMQSRFPYFKAPFMVLEEKKEKLNEEAKSLDKDVDEAVKGPPFSQFAGFFSLDTIRASAGQYYRADFPKKFEEAPMNTALPGDMGYSERKKVVDTTKALADYSRLNDVLVLRLAGIASEKGIEYAMREETIAGVKKEMFPTPELYRKHMETGKDLIANGMYTAFDSLGEQPAKTNEIIRTSFKKGLEAYVGVATRIQDGIEEHEINEIYGAESQQLEDELEAAIAANRNRSIKYSPVMSGSGHRRL